jgi:hypothetical protein
MTKNGALLFLTAYRQWVYLSSGLDMDYNPVPRSREHSIFDNVFESGSVRVFPEEWELAGQKLFWFWKRSRPQARDQSIQVGTIRAHRHLDAKFM